MEPGLHFDRLPSGPSIFGYCEGEAYFEPANPHCFCSIAICLVMRVAFSE